MNRSGFDKILREKLSGYRQPFNEGSWQNMEAMLDNQKPKRRPFIFFLIFGAVVIAASSYLLLRPGMDNNISGSNQVSQSVESGQLAVQDVN